jgi:DNA-binding winged helix-turn-helix (wHTH) protein
MGYRFENFHVSRYGVIEGRHLQPKQLEVLLYLLEHSGRHVSKRELFERVWKQTCHDELQLRVVDSAVHRLRVAINDTVKPYRLIDQRSRYGWRFHGPFTVAPDVADHSGPKTSQGRLKVPNIIASGHDFRLTRLMIREWRRVTRHSTLRVVEAQIRSNVDDLQSIELDETIEDTTPSLVIRPKSFKWKILAAPQGLIIRRHVLIDSREQFRWAFTMTPGLRRGEVVHYCYKLHRMNLQPHTMEDLLARVSAGTYPLKRPLCKAIGAVADESVMQYSCEVSFERGYIPSAPFCEVYWTRSKQYNAEETERVRSAGMFLTWARDDRYHVRLDVAAPVRGCSYFVFYAPPAWRHLPPRSRPATIRRGGSNETDSH